MKVVLVDIAPLDTALAEVKEGDAIEKFDVSDLSAVNELIAHVLKSHGAPTLLANNAGIARSPGGTAIKGSGAIFCKTMEVKMQARWP